MAIKKKVAPKKVAPKKAAPVEEVEVEEEEVEVEVEETEEEAEEEEVEEEAEEVVAPKTVKKAAPKKAAPKKAAPKKSSKTTKAAPKKTTKAAKAPAAPKKTSKINLKTAAKTVSDKFKIPSRKSADDKAPRCTQEAFTQEFLNNLMATGLFESAPTKVMVEKLQEAYGLTLAEVTNNASFFDKYADIYYKNVSVDTRVYNPPKSDFETVVQNHFEVKVQKVIGDKSLITFDGAMDDESGIFTTTDGVEIVIHEFEEEE